MTLDGRSFLIGTAVGEQLAGDREAGGPTSTETSSLAAPEAVSALEGEIETLNRRLANLLREIEKKDSELNGLRNANDGLRGDLTAAKALIQLLEAAQAKANTPSGTRDNPLFLPNTQLEKSVHRARLGDGVNFIGRINGGETVYLRATLFGRPVRVHFDNRSVPNQWMAELLDEPGASSTALEALTDQLRPVEAAPSIPPSAPSAPSSAPEVATQFLEGVVMDGDIFVGFQEDHQPVEINFSRAHQGGVPMMVAVKMQTKPKGTLLCAMMNGVPCVLEKPLSSGEIKVYINPQQGSPLRSTFCTTPQGVYSNIMKINNR